MLDYVCGSNYEEGNAGSKKVNIPFLDFNWAAQVIWTGFSQLFPALVHHNMAFNNMLATLLSLENHLVLI